MNDHAARFSGDPGQPVLIIAELSCNHRQDFAVALRTLAAMKEAGADAVKLQTYTPDTLTLPVDNEHFRIRTGGLWDGRTLYDLYREAMTPWAWHEPLRDEARRLGLLWFSSPFDPTAVEFLERLAVPAYKVASFEITDVPLLRRIAACGKPVLLSTGIAERADIDEALAALRGAGNDRVMLMQCTSAYPAPAAESNLRSIPWLASTYGVPVGLSDHTPGWTVPVAAVALGARAVEKHFILDRTLGGPDAAFSLIPDEFAAMVRAIRETEQALGTDGYAVTGGMRRNRYFARSLFITAAAAAGTVLTNDLVRSVRPGTGLHPRHLPEVIGRRLVRDVPAGTPLHWDLLL